MKRRFLVPLCALTLIITRAPGQESEQSIPSVIVVPTLDTEVQPGKVVAWSAAMPAMWRELCDHLGTDKIVLTPESKLANVLNTWKQDPAVILPKDGYLVLSGNGTKASVQVAREQLKRKFNEDWPELDALLRNPMAEDMWFAFCMLKQTLRFEPVFLSETQRAMIFKDGLGQEHNVKYFGTVPSYAKMYTPVVQVLEYKSPNTAISIKSDIPDEHLYLCTRVRKNDGSYLTSMAETVEHIRRVRKELHARIAAGDLTAGRFGEGDLLEIPEVHFKGIKQHLDDLTGFFRVTDRGMPQKFLHASHSVAFDMDESGVKIVGFGKGIGIGGVPPKPAHLRAFVFDEPFFVVAWRDNAPLPYFVAYVDGEQAFLPSSGETGDSFVSLPPSFKSRCSMAERLNALKVFGGTLEQEKMVSHSLEYLKAAQNPDGSWGDDHSLEITSQVLLAYLARCETPDSPFYGDNILKTVLWMVEQLKINPPANRSLRESAIATQALGEMYILARLGTHSLPGLYDSVITCAKDIIDRQLPDGTWGAEDEEGYIITGHCIEALVAARTTNLKLEGLRPALERVQQYYLKTPAPQNLSPDAALLRAAIAVNTSVSHSTFAEPAESKLTSLVKSYRNQASTTKLQWNESSSLDHWLLIPLATRRYPDLFKTFFQGPVQGIAKAQDDAGSIKSGPSMKNQPTLSAKDIELRRTITGLLVLELPYRFKPRLPGNGSIFDREASK
ncbi:hypothetical protein BH11VER1_BH11VER1_42230 [soil metagenome]